MLFGRAPVKENIPLSELEAYLNRCFDAKLRRLSTRLPEIEAGLAKSHTALEAAAREFSKSDPAPDMEYLYGVKESYLKSQKANYSSSLLHLVSARPEYGGACLYLKGQAMLAAHSSFTGGVMKVNNTFKLVMIGYAKGLTGVKQHFTAIERLCKELGSELATCSIEEHEYSKIRSRISAMLESVAEMEAVKNNQEHGQPGIFEESALALAQKQLEEKEKGLELAKRDHRDADSALASLLLPMERVARKHDHISPAKRKLADYIKEPAERIRTAEDIDLINRHLTEVTEEIRTGKVDAKNSAGLVSQIEAIGRQDLLALAESSRRAAAGLKEAEAELVESRVQLQALEKGRAEKQRIEGEKARVEHEITQKSARLASEKKELEKLFLSCYRKETEIVLR
jgi:hypothetical protein